MRDPARATRGRHDLADEAKRPKEKMIRRTPLVVRIEQRYGAPIEAVLRRLLSLKGPAEVVEELSVSPSTLGYWCLVAGIPMRREEVIGGARVGG